MALALGVSACSTLTVEEEAALGRHEQAVVQQRCTLLRDPVVVSYLRRLGAELAKHERPSPFELRFYVVEDENLNAFAIPGGSVYVNTGLLLEVRDPGELAAILAHEIGHVTARHIASQYRRARNTGLLAQIAALAARLFTRQPDLGELLAQVGANVYLNTYTQDAEREADRLAIETLLRSGYDPCGMIRVLQMLEAKSRGPRAPSFLSSHPAPPERIQNVRAEIEARVEAGEIGTEHRDRAELLLVQRGSASSSGAMRTRARSDPHQRGAEGHEVACEAAFGRDDQRRATTSHEGGTRLAALGKDDDERERPRISVSAEPTHEGRRAAARSELPPASPDGVRVHDLP